MPIKPPYLSRPWACLLSGVGLAVLGAALAVGWIVLANALEWDIGAKLRWPDALGPIAIVIAPATLRCVSLLRRRRRREAIFTGVGGILGTLLVMAGALILLGIALAGAMPRHD